MERSSLSLVSLAGATIGGSLISLLFTSGPMSPSRAASTGRIQEQPIGRVTCAYDIARGTGFDRIRPVLFSESRCESTRLEGLRSSIATLVEGMKNAGQVISASVYVSEFKRSEWTTFNGDEVYDPGSMLKVPLLITYLSMSEEDPSLLSKTWTCEAADFNVPQFSAFPEPQIQQNVSYTVAQLLEYAIVHSDNRATVMLLRHVGPTRYIRTFTGMGLPAPEWSDAAYRMSVRSFSVFMKSLYNSSILSPMNSERALQMLTRAGFKQGIMAGLPNGVEAAHKFGESGTPQERQLHESGLVYAKDGPYLITVMTRGTDPHQLADAIARISRTVHDRMSAL